MMYNKKFMEELFKPQYLYSKKAMRTVFDRLAHASIMRLNAASMDKLYDLMMMAFKHQVLLSLTPSDVLLVTLNHIDTIRVLIKDSQLIKQQVDLVYQLLIETYGALKSGDFYLIRETLLNFFQDMHIRVSIFLKDNTQTSNGRFTQPLSGHVAWGTEVPGSIRLYDSGGNVSRQLTFASGGDYCVQPRKGSLDLRGDRITKLGCNMYSDDKSDTASTFTATKKTMSSDVELCNPDPLAKAQLDLLAKLIGSANRSSHEFRLNLFDTDLEEEEVQLDEETPSAADNVIKINATKSDNTELQRIMGELKVEDDSGDVDKGDDLLYLMDSAE